MKNALVALTVSLAALNPSPTFGLSLPVSIDTSTTARGAVTVATGKASTLAVSPNRNALIYFDLMGLPSSFTATNLVGARLRFYIAKTTKPGDLAIHSILNPWDEATEGPAPSISADPILTVPSSRIAGKRFVIVDVTHTVKQWLADPTANYGLALVAADGSPTLKAILGAKEGPGIGHPAELELEVNAAAGIYQDGDPSTGKIDGQNISPTSIGSTQLEDGSVTDSKIVSVSGGKITGSVAVSLSAITVNGVGVSAAPAAGALLPLDSTGRFPLSTLPVGIGSNVNAELLDGLDSTAFAPANDSTVYLAKTGGTMTGPLILPEDGLVAANNQFVLTGGNIGIGTGAPSTKLTVNGIVTATSFSGSGAGLTGLSESALPGNIARLDSPGIFTAPQTLQIAGGGTAVTIRATPGQTDALQQWQDGTGATVATLSPSGVFSGNGSGLTNLSANSIASGIVPISRGGTGASVQTYVDLSSNQTISGQKTFAGVIVGNLNGNASTAANFTGSLGGDIAGTQGATTVLALRGISLSATAPVARQFLRFNGSAWTPGVVTLETDVSGILPNANFAGTYSSAVTLSNANNNLAGNGAEITNINASNLASGGVPDGRLSGTYGSALSLTNAANSFSGTLTGTGDSDLQGNLLKNPALGTLLFHPTFEQGLVGDNSGGGVIQVWDGTVSLHGGGLLSYCQIEGGGNLSIPLNKVGAFISARLVLSSDPHTGDVFYMVVGTSVHHSGNPYAGFGFKIVGTALKGVTINGIGGPDPETVVDLATTLNSQPTIYAGVNLLAVRRATSVEFYVDGILKGSSSTNLPMVASSYVFRLKSEGPTTGRPSFRVGYVTIGSPMF